MSFILTCPNCGAREVNEFRYGGEITAPSVPISNQPGVQQERWFHRFGCHRWLIAERDLRTNSVLRTGWLEGEAT